MTPTPQAGDARGIGTPSSAWRIRRDAWEHLGYALTERARHHERSTAGRPASAAEITRLIGLLSSLEPYWAVPGVRVLHSVRELYEQGRFREALELVEGVNAIFLTLGIRPDAVPAAVDEESLQTALDLSMSTIVEVLVVDDRPFEETEKFRQALLAQRRPTDDFAYEVNFVPSAEDAVAAIVVNPNIQACILTPRFGIETHGRLSRQLAGFVAGRLGSRVSSPRAAKRILGLASVIGELRPELDVYLLAGVALESLASTLTGRFQRIFSRSDFVDLHSSILRGIGQRYETPFFAALQEYSRHPAGVFHAMPISRAGSVHDSPWIRDLEEFYGLNLLLAETSATAGGLDSLLEPRGAIRQAHVSAARAFHADRTYFVTNGTSTANKIVHQAVIAPGDIVLVDRNCHKSHHYSLVLAGAYVSYLEAYPLDEHSLYGAVPVEALKRRLLEFRDQGLLDRVKMIALTNCTFDGIVYDPRRVMEECLAIKPDLVFLWDEAWFAFACAHPIYRRRTAMQAAHDLHAAFVDPAYARRHAEQQEVLDDLAGADGGPGDADEALIRTRLIPDPQRARVRVYATQSTHKTLTSLRQGSMIHVFDQDFSTLGIEAFSEAYMTHTSTSPNYQIIASMDIGRRQVELEGYALVQRQTELALSIRDAVARHPLLKKYFRVLDTRDLIPAKYRRSDSASPARIGLAAWDASWKEDEFVVDPSRLTLDISATGVDGDTFKHDYLMDGHRIQVNKTSRTSVLLMTNIGTSRSSVAYLIEVLVKIAEQFEQERSLGLDHRTTAVQPGEALPSLPDFSRFADRFQRGAGAGDVRQAYYGSYDPTACEFLSSAQVRRRLESGDEVVSANFVTPYPPGFPVLVPGQVFTLGILDYMDALDTREIHGYSESTGYRVFV